MGNKKLAINMISKIIAFAVSFGISFFLSPYIVRTLGKEAYGFIPLMSNSLDTMQIVLIALNSMGARFITIKIHQNDNESANKYFNSLLIANCVIALVLFIPLICLAIYVNKIFDVPAHLLNDVRISFSLISMDLLISLAFSIFTVSTFVKNRLDLTAMRDIISELIRATIIVLCFLLFKPTIIFVSFSAIVSLVYRVITDYKYTKNLMPEIILSRKYFDFSAIKELVSSGVWNSLGKLNYVLLSGLDLMFSNIFISAAIMGTLAISKTVPSAINTFIATISSVFVPQILILYAKNEIASSLNIIRKATKILSYFIAPALAFLVGYGDVFYKLWMPNNDVRILQLLSILTILPMFFTCGIQSIEKVFTITNKLRAPIIANAICAGTSTLIVLILIKTTNLGVYAIAGTSSICSIVKDLTFTPIYAAKCLGIKKTTFYSQLLIGFIIITISLIISLLFRMFTHPSSWFELIACAGISSIIILTVNSLFIINREMIQLAKTLISSWLNKCLKRGA